MRVLATILCALIVTIPAPALAASPDPWITTKVKIALVTNEALGGLRIDVDTVDGQVTLHGKAYSEQERAKAEEIARSVPEVKKVRNLLQVVPAKRRERTDATDQWLQREISDRLAKIAEGRIRLASVHDGVVLLSGDAISSAEHLRAIEAVRRVRGVRRVASEVRTTKDDAALDVWNGHELRQGGASFADVAGDIWITAEVRLALYAEDDVPTGDISVDTRNGVVTLFGSVATEDQKEEAEDEAEDVDGVRSVRNLLQVVPTTKQESVEKTDAEIQPKVLEAIYARPEMKGAAVRADVRNRFVRLKGTVASRQLQLVAASAARSVAGVRAVDTDDLRVMTMTEGVPRR
jgi:osmotically-inducible protein OsmY